MTWQEKLQTGTIPEIVDEIRHQIPASCIPLYRIYEAPRLINPEKPDESNLIVEHRQTLVTIADRLKEADRRLRRAVAMIAREMRQHYPETPLHDGDPVDATEAHHTLLRFSRELEDTISKGYTP